MSDFFNSPVLITLLVIVPLIVGFVKKKRLFLSLFLPAETIIIFAIQTIKKITAEPRPFIDNPQVLGVVSNIPNDYSFPSLHTALGAAFAWIMSLVYPRLSWLWFGVLVIIASSRITMGLHYSKDVIAGFSLSTLIFWTIYLISRSKRFLNLGGDPSTRRKIIHMFYGLILVFLLDYNLISDKTFFAWLIVSFIIVIISPNLPQIARSAINYFEREKDHKYLAVTPLLFTASCFLTWVIFPKNIALAAIISLAIGDSVNALIGSMWKVNGRKIVEIALAAFFATLLVTLPYVTPIQAVFGSFVTMIFEFLEPKIGGKKINDNLFIPLVAAAIMSLVARVLH